MADVLKVDDPFTGEIVFERPLLSMDDLDGVMERAQRAHREWKTVPLEERVQLVQRFIQAFEERADAHALDITRSMGKPLAQAHGEIRGMCDRARQMASIAHEGLADICLPDKPGFERRIVRDPVGVVAPPPPLVGLLCFSVIVGFSFGFTRPPLLVGVVAAAAAAALALGSGCGGLRRCAGRRSFFFRVSVPVLRCHRLSDREALSGDRMPSSRAVAMSSSA